MISPANRRKLGVFTVITLATLLVIGAVYMRVPRQLGAGVYTVSLDLPESGGLYDEASVTFRGVEIGTVSDLRLTKDGIRADLVLDNSAEVPSKVRAEVHSMSAIGEQYVDLIPLDGAGEGDVLEHDDVIEASQVQMPVPTGALLGSVNALLRSVPEGDVDTVIHEAYEGLSGIGPTLGGLLDAASAVQTEASVNLKPTLDLIRSLGPVLGTQRNASDQIKAYTANLADFTEEVAADDPAIRELLRSSKPLNDQLTKLYAGLSPDLAVVLADLATSGRVAQAYIPALEHTLILFPALVVAAQSVIPASRYDDPITLGNVDFKLDAGNPPVCIEGFADAKKQRSPHDLTQVPPPSNSYCKIAPDDRRIVRGARNLPCPNAAGRRGPTAKSCGLVFDRVAVPFAPRPASTLAGYDPNTGLLIDADNNRVQMNDLTRTSEPDTLDALMRETVGQEAGAGATGAGDGASDGEDSGPLRLLSSWTAGGLLALLLAAWLVALARRRKKT